MFKKLIMFNVFLLLTLGTFAQEKLINNAFQAGEHLKYKVYYNSSFGNFNAGNVEVIVSEITEGHGQFYKISGTGETNRFFDIFYKVRDRFETQVDTETLLPKQFSRRTREGNFEHDDDVVFNREEKIALSKRAKKPVPDDIHDIISAVFFMRTLGVEDFGDDSSYYINFYLDDSVYQSKILFEGHVVLATEFGWLPCLKVKPMMATGEVFSRKYPLTVYVTDDENHVPVMAGSDIIVGSVRMELIEYDGLKSPFIEPLTKKELRELKKH